MIFVENVTDCSGPLTMTAISTLQNNVSTHRQRSAWQSNCARAGSRSGTRRFRRPASGPTWSAASSRRCFCDASPGSAGPRCTCSCPPSGCECPGAVSRRPVGPNVAPRGLLLLAPNSGSVIFRGFRVQLWCVCVRAWRWKKGKVEKRETHDWVNILTSSIGDTDRKRVDFLFPSGEVERMFGWMVGVNMESKGQPFIFSPF